MRSTVVPAFILFAVLCSVPMGATAGTCREEVMFKKGATSAQVKGQISGYNYCDYLLRAKKGQLLSVQSSSTKADIMLQGPMEKLLKDSEPVTLGADGVYTVRILMPRALARKNQKEAYSLNITITTPDQNGQVAPAPDGHSSKNSVDWPGYYHGLVPCASCPGIDTWVSLTEQNKIVEYALTENYLEEADGYFQSHGAASWSKDGQSLQLKGTDGTRALFVAEGAVAFLPEGQNVPADNSDYWLEKLDVFSGNQEMLFVSPAKVSVNVSGAEMVVSIKDGVMNFEHATEAGHASLKTDLEILCNAQKYAMPAIVYYQKPFAGGKVLDQGGNGQDRLDFAGSEDVVTKAAAQYCQ